MVNPYELPLIETENPRLFQIGRNVARALADVELEAVIPYQDEKHPNPFLRTGYTFRFRRWNKQVLLARLYSREVAGQPDHVLIQTLIGVFQHGRS